jgi:2-deoxy-D-gluconate 3-dehydrogenase
MVHQLFDIEGKHALVTGSGSGIGLGMAEGLLEAGCKVILHSHGENAKKECERLKGLGFDADYVLGDLTTEEGANTVFAEALKKLDGVIDILVNNAGAQFRAPALEFPLEEFDRVMNVNNRTVFILSKLAAENMMLRGYGKIINTASMQSFFGLPYTPAYAASKGAIVQLTKAIGNEWISKGINVNALAPGWIATNLTRAVTQDPARTTEIMSRLPAGRWGDPSDFKGPVIFLASAASDYLSGAVIPVDGGYLTR